jgi:hypothetical protein
MDNNKIWKTILDSKYDLAPNVFWANPSQCSPFLKGVMWAAYAAKSGYRWHVGNGNKVLFWEDIWIGNCSLATLYWDIYVIVNEHNVTIADVWDGQELKCSFRRTVDDHMYNRWLELVSLISTISLTNGEDMPIWMFHPSGVYSVKSFYAIINNRGVCGS